MCVRARGMMGRPARPAERIPSVDSSRRGGNAGFAERWLAGTGCVGIPSADGGMWLHSRGPQGLERTWRHVTRSETQDRSSAGCTQGLQ